MKEILNYLAELEFNNNREWYAENKEKRDSANKKFEEFIASLIGKIGKEDPEIIHNDPKTLTFKQVRDTRFSADKSPYNPSFRAHIAAKGKLPVPVGYYIMIKPGNRSFLGGGLFADMFKDATVMIRNYVAQYGAELENIVNAPEFKKYFTVKGNALKKAPPEFGADHPYAEWLKYKCMYLEYSVCDEFLTSEDFVDKSSEIFLAMKPFNDFLNRALKDFKMPER